MNAWLSVALAGAVIGTLCDRLHVVYHVLAYPGGGQPWWVPPEFALAGVALVAGARAFRRRFARDAAPPRHRAARTVGDGVAFGAAYFVTAAGHDRPFAVLAILVVAWLVRFALAPSRFVALFALGCAVVGPLCEATLVALGRFHYLAPHLAAVPMWLPALYAFAALLGVSLEAAIRGAAR